MRQVSTSDAASLNPSRAATPFDSHQSQPRYNSDHGALNKRLSVSRTPSVPTASHPPSSFPQNGLVELTKNSKYCVLKLPAAPVFLKNASQDEHLTGSTDESTSYSLVVSQKGVYVWKYILSEDIPQVFFFESSTTTSSHISLSSLVSPIAGIKEPGLITVIPHTGIVTYWESVGGAIANELLQKKKSIIHQLKLHGSEHIEYIENIEPAGIVAVTNVGRFILITYRDGTGKPILQSETMKSFGSGFFATIKDAVTLSGSRRNVISIKPGKSVGRDERHAVAITETGNLMIWDCFRTGQAHLLLEENLRDVMLNSISSLYPQANATFTVHDVEYHCVSDYVYVLGSFVNSQATQEVAYFLFTFTIQQNVLNIVTTHQFKTFTSPSSCRPKLLLPKPYNTIFVLFSDAVILTDAIPDNLHELSSVTRWEDIVTFLSGVEAFAFGKEDLVETNKKVIRYPGIIAMTKQAGILRIERYTDNNDLSEKPNTTEQSNDLDFEIAKTKVEQAVFYGHKDKVENPVDFEIRKEFQLDPSVLNNAFSQVSKEIVGSTSPYLPPTLPSLGDHLEMRWDALIHMAEFLHQNFPNELSLEARLQLLWDLEELYAAKSLWEGYNNKLSDQAKNNVLSDIISATDPSVKGDKVRNWFIRSIKNIPQLLLQASLYSAKNDKNIAVLKEVNEMILTAISFSAYPARVSFGTLYFGVTEDTYGSAEPWTGSNQVLAAFSHQYQQTVKTLDSISKQDQNHYVILSQQLVHLVGTLCNIHCDRISWLKTVGEKSQSNRLSQTYETTRGEWIHNLVKFGQKQEAQQISETYKIYKSLASILGEDYLSEVKNTGRDTVASLGIIAKLQEYIKTFGYDFASVLFQYYVDTQQLKSLLKQFPQYNEYLERFLVSGNYGSISWIHDLLVNKNEQAASTLLKVATEKESTPSNKRLQLSIAKLSALVSDNSQPPNTANVKTITLQQRINSQLELVEIQEIVNHRVQINLNKNNDQVSVYIDQISHFLKSHNLKQLQSVLSRALIRLVGKQTLTINELVDVLTLSDVGTNSGSFDNADSTTRLNFFLAFKLIHLFAANISASQIKLNEQIIWRRLFLRDDWFKLNQTENKADSIVESAFSKTILYETLIHIFQEGLDKSLDMSYALDPEKAVWRKIVDKENGEDSNDSERLLLSRYRFISDNAFATTISTSNKTENNKTKAIFHDVKKENSLLRVQLDNYNLGRWAQGIYSQAQKVASLGANGNSSGASNIVRGNDRIMNGKSKQEPLTKKPLFVRNEDDNKDIDMKDQKEASTDTEMDNNDQDIEME